MKRPVLKHLATLLIFAASAAEAHGTLPGGGGFYAGALHPLVALEHLLVQLAAGLALGRDGHRLPFGALAVALGAGLWVGWLWRVFQGRC